MTVKRFHYKIDEVGVYYYICDGGKTEDKIFAEVIGDVKEVTDKLNELAEENEQSKMMIATLRNIVLEQEDLEKENMELKAFKEKVFEWIDGEIDSVKESCNILMTSDEAEAVMDTLIELKNELSGEKND